MSQQEILLFIQYGLNHIIDKKELEDIIELYKLSLLIKNSDDENYRKLFIYKYIDYYHGRIEFINGIKNMSDNMIEEIKQIIINSTDLYVKRVRNNHEEFKKKYEERKNKFLNLSSTDIRKAMIEEQLSGIHSQIDDINALYEKAKTINYPEMKELSKINIDFELEKIKEKRKHKYTEDGNFSDDDEVLKIVTNNLKKRGYLSHHLHIYVYEELENSISVILEKNRVIKKIY